MTVQFQILKENFNISPSVVIAIIDQTDIGDELCRYRSKIKFDNNKKKMFIEREKKTLEQFLTIRNIIIFRKLYLKGVILKNLYNKLLF